ncbi:MAG: DNA repair protein RecO [Bacteroidales bacterium]|jgi:DNA repair protein RecO (recombination protein O)|nr:DNA repair protein RecO [Bacteroidales bacterium]
MLKKTEGIVLHRIKYSETSFIVHIYTRHEGIASFIIGNARSKRSQAAFFQPLHIVNFEYYEHPKSSLSRIKEISFAHVPVSLHRNIQKSTIALFVSEFLYHSFVNKEENGYVYEFLRDFVVALDCATDPCNNAHIDFLIDFADLCGISPQNNYNTECCYFDSTRGNFATYTSATTCNRESSALMHRALTKNYSNFTSAQRRDILHLLLHYFSLHTKKIDMTRTLSILEVVFHTI